MRVFVMKLPARHLFLLVLFVFLLASMATDRHFAHSAGAKLIGFDHQVRRNLSRAERADLRTSALSCKVEAGPTPLQGIVGFLRRPEFVLSSYGIPHPLIPLRSKTSIFEFSPILNL
jgi:hypothetical protein